MKNNVEESIVFEIKVRLEGDDEIWYGLVRHNVGDLQDIAGVGYSIQIKSHIQEGSEYIFLEDVSREYEEGVELITEFAKNTVTPESAIYIMEDLFT